MEPVQNQPPQPIQTFDPQSINTQEPTAESLPQDQPVSPKRFKFKTLLISAVSLLLILTLSSGYFFWWVPEAAAKEFIEKTSASFSQINGEVDTVFANFQKIKEEGTLAKAAFTEITKTTKDYNYTKKDTQEDINDISTVLPKVKEAKAQIENLEKPQKVEKLATALQDYYSTLKVTLENLLEQENLQLKEIDAHGQELYDLLIKQEAIEYISLLRKISDEAFAAKARTELISNTDSLEEVQIKSRIQYFQDLGQSYREAALLFEQRNDQAGLELISAFGKRTKKLNEGIQELANRFVVESESAIGFAKLPDLEAKVLEEFKNLDVDIPVPSPTPEQESTPSAQPATPSAQPSESTASATTSATP